MIANSSIQGLGIVSTLGRGIEALRSGLAAAWQPPISAIDPKGQLFSAYRLPAGTLDDKSLGRKVRRADRLSKMAVFAAAEALNDAQLPADLDRKRIGLIVASALGTHVTTFQFLDEILTYGDPGVSPTVFSHSVQNAPAAYIASTLDVQGPVLTLTQVHFGFHHALILADRWLRNGQCEYVLVGGMDELGSVMEYICQSMLTPAKDGMIRPFAFGVQPGSVPGEGSVFAVLSATSNAAYGKVRCVELSPWSAPEESPDLHLLEADGTLPDESGYSEPAESGALLAGYAPLFGSMPGGTALQFAAAALMLKEQVRFASPAVDSQVTLPVCRATEPASLTTIQLTRLNCAGLAGCITLKTS